jgi:hypothetical protein
VLRRPRQRHRAALALLALVGAAFVAVPPARAQPAPDWTFVAAAAGAANAAIPAAAESLAAFPSPRVRAWQVGLLRPDRLQHAGLSFTLGAGFTLAFQDRVAAAGVTLALGAGKEWWDARRGRGADAMDLVADAVGLGLALVAVRGRAP